MTEFNRPAFENTYRLEPKETDRFYPSKVRDCVEQVVIAHLKDKEYDHAPAKIWAEKIAEEIKSLVKNTLSIPSYKVVVQTVIGQISGQGVRVASKCLWDDENDNYASFTYTNNSLFCTGIVFGIYYE
jgi:hypothetical protein